MFEMTPIGYVGSTRRNVEDDYWGGVEARITLTEAVGADALDGIEEFSHAEIIYFFDKVDPAKIVNGARHSRNNPAWPKIGIFAQRGKNRPNRIGSTIVRILRREVSTLHVSGLDAIDDTPVLDIKPVMAEFLPREPVVQPAWSRELMKAYWNYDGRCAG
jgi:tRNA (Thr-GGU) A37 N-methylase